MKTENDIYNYLSNKNFKYFLKQGIFNHKKTINDKNNLPKEDKAIEMINLMALLHNKTTTYEILTLNQIQELYESKLNEIHKQKEYYYNYQNYIESKIFYSPAEYLLIRNISLIYKILNTSEIYFNKWYELIKLKKEIRVAMINNNVNLNNLIYIEEEPYIIDWNDSKKDIIIYDFENLYRKEFNNLEMLSLYNIYKSKYYLKDTEELLLFSLLLIPNKMELTKNNFINVIKIRNLTDYVKQTLNFVSENDKIH